MYSVGRHSRRSSSSRNRTGKPYAAHLARLDYLLIYLPTQVRLTLTKIIKIVATRWQILRLKCTKFDFGWGSAPDPAGEAYSAPPDPLAGFGGPTTKERGRKGREEERRGEGRRGKGKERDMSPPLFGRSLRLWVTRRGLQDVTDFRRNGFVYECSHLYPAIITFIDLSWYFIYPADILVTSFI